MDEPSTREELLIREREGWSELKELTDSVPASRTDDFDWNTEENNARFITSGRSASFPEAVSALEKSREGVVLAMKSLEQVSPEALEFFFEPAYRHMVDHVPELRRFLEATPR